MVFSELQTNSSFGRFYTTCILSLVMGAGIPTANSSANACSLLFSLPSSHIRNILSSTQARNDFLNGLVDWKARTLSGRWAPMDLYVTEVRRIITQLESLGERSAPITFTESRARDNIGLAGGLSVERQPSRLGGDGYVEFRSRSRTPVHKSLQTEIIDTYRVEANSNTGRTDYYYVGTTQIIQHSSILEAGGRQLTLVLEHTVDRRQNYLDIKMIVDQGPHIHGRWKSSDRNQEIAMRQTIDLISRGTLEENPDAFLEHLVASFRVAEPRRIPNGRPIHESFNQVMEQSFPTVMSFEAKSEGSTPSGSETAPGKAQRSLFE